MIQGWMSSLGEATPIIDAFIKRYNQAARPLDQI
jgi:hypothetical protein